MVREEESSRNLFGAQGWFWEIAAWRGSGVRGSWLVVSGNTTERRISFRNPWVALKMERNSRGEMGKYSGKAVELRPGAENNFPRRLEWWKGIASPRASAPGW